MSLRRTRLTNPFAPLPGSRSALTGQNRSASARETSRRPSEVATCDGPLRSSSRSRSYSSTTSISSAAETPAAARFFSAFTAEIVRSRPVGQRSVERADVSPGLGEAELANSYEQQCIHEHPEPNRRSRRKKERRAAKRKGCC